MRTYIIKGYNRGEHDVWGISAYLITFFFIERMVRIKMRSTKYKNVIFLMSCECGSNL